MGAYGFLAGTTMEKTGLPNAGLYDQRAALEWIQDYIGLVGGDKSQVSAWGLSAGAGSILHQLVAFGGTQDPLFSRAVLQSPAFQFTFDRKGSLEQTFQNFTALAGCAGQGVACLRAASAETLDRANTKLNEEGTMGTFAVGPSPDGNLIRQSPSLEFASGNSLHPYQVYSSLTPHPQETSTNSPPPSSSPTSPTNPTSSSPPTSKQTLNSPPSSTPSSPHTPKPPASTPRSKPATLPPQPPIQTTPPSAPASTTS